MRLASRWRYALIALLAAAASSPSTSQAPHLQPQVRFASAERLNILTRATSLRQVEGGAVMIGEADFNRLVSMTGIAQKEATRINLGARLAETAQVPNHRRRYSDAIGLS